VSRHTAQLFMAHGA